MTRVGNTPWSIGPHIRDIAEVLLLYHWCCRFSSQENRRKGKMTSPSWVRTMPDSFWPPDNLTLVSALQQLSIIPHSTHRHWGRRRHGQASQSWHLRRVQGSKEAGQAQEGTKDIQWPLRRHFCPKWTFWIRKIGWSLWPCIWKPSMFVCSEFHIIYDLTTSQIAPSS